MLEKENKDEIIAFLRNKLKEIKRISEWASVEDVPKICDICENALSETTF